MNHRRFYLSIAALSLVPGLSLAAAIELPRAPTPEGWQVTLGVAPVFAPVYSGSQDYALSIYPDIRLRYEDKFFASIPEGMGYNAINTREWKAGPLIKLRFGRNEDTGGSSFLVSGETDALLGMGDIDPAGEAGGFVEYRSGEWGTRVEIRQGFGGHDGLIGDVNLNYFNKIGSVRYTVGPRMTLASDGFTNTYYGVTQAQSQATGYAYYEAGGGLVSVGLGASAFMPLGGQWNIGVIAGYDKLMDDANDSPFVEESNQFSLIGSLNYRF
ncbi:MAG: MipA/OmpV family protein [Pseudomonadota bacterium]